MSHVVEGFCDFFDLIAGFSDHSEIFLNCVGFTLAGLIMAALVILFTTGIFNIFCLILKIKGD